MRDLKLNIQRTSLGHQTKIEDKKSPGKPVRKRSFEPKARSNVLDIDKQKVDEQIVSKLRQSSKEH